jgi:hypothetical protein
MMVTTCCTFPRGELSWQLAAAEVIACAPVGAEAAALAGAAHAGAAGYKAMSTAVAVARALRPHSAQALAPEPFLLVNAEFEKLLTGTS